MTVLVVGIILIALLVAVSALQWALRRRQTAKERALPHVAELEVLALTPDEFPSGYHIHYRGPLTNERLAYQTDDEPKVLDELDEVGRVIGYRQAFRSPRSYGELIDVPLNLTLRSSTQQRLVTVDLSLFEDAEGATDFVGEPPPPPDDPNLDNDAADGSIRVSDVGSHELDFADSVRQWSRMQRADEVQRKVEVRWRSGRLGCVVTGDSEPPGGIEAKQICELAQRIQDRIATSPLAQAPATS
ncbi:MAG: hypothetical protein DK306_000703 [Chloroflexi bacterium]|nr:MAG: hypothetical protein DK306_000703 [Chloroflexota bacterium]